MRKGGLGEEGASASRGDPAGFKPRWVLCLLSALLLPTWEWLMVEIQAAVRGKSNLACAISPNIAHKTPPE